MARKFGANCSKCQRSTEQQQSIKCFKIHSKDLLQNNDFHITSSIFLLFFLILFSNSIVYRFFIARIFGVLPEYFRDWGGCRRPPPPAPPARTPMLVGSQAQLAGGGVGEDYSLLYGLYFGYKKHVLINVINNIFCLFICRLFIGCITSAFVLAVVVFAITLYIFIMFFVDRGSLKSLTGKQLITLSCIFEIKLW